MKNPLYYRSSNPSLANVASKADKLFEWDGTGTMPSELVAGKGAMPPAEISGETTIWSDSYTLGYTDEANASPVFFSDGAVGDAKVLRMINHVANRVGVAMFVDVVAAKSWATTAGAMFFAEPGSSLGSKILYIDVANTISAENVKWVWNPASAYPNSGGSYAMHTNPLSGNSSNLTQLSFTIPPHSHSGNATEFRTFLQNLPGKAVRIYNTFDSTTQWADVNITSIINDQSDPAIHTPQSISFNVTLINDNGWDQLLISDTTRIRVEFYNI